MYMYIYIYEYVYVYLYVCMYVCINQNISRIYKTSGREFNIRQLYLCKYQTEDTYTYQQKVVWQRNNIFKRFQYISFYMEL
jgi:hypothetical protein